MFSETLDNRDFRMDSNFWNSKPFINENLVYDKIGNILDESQYGISIKMNEQCEGYPIYRMNEIHNMLCDLSVNKYADISFEEFKKYNLSDGDVLFNRTNSMEWVGRTGIFKGNSYENSIFASYLVRFSPKPNLIKPEYLTAFLNTKYAVKDIKRRARHSVNQANVNPEEVKEIDIPITGDAFQNLIVELFAEADIYRKKSVRVIEDANKLLNKLFDITNNTFTRSNTNRKSLTEVIDNGYRFDSEHYDLKYDVLHEILVNSSNETVKLKDYLTFNKRGLQPIYVEDGIVKVVNSKHILESSLNYDDFESTSLYYWETQNRASILKGDILIYTTGANIGRANIFQEDYKAIASNHVNILRVEGIDPYYVAFIVNSFIGRMQTAKWKTGSAQAEIYPSDFERFIIPIVDDNYVSVFRNAMIDSLQYSKRSNYLLDTAVKAVEQVIECSEQDGISYIKNMDGGNDHAGL